MVNRRTWLKSALAFSAGVPISMSLSEKLMSAPLSETERDFFKTTAATHAKIRLDSNENPYGPSEKGKQAIKETIGEANRYPFQTLRELKEILAAKEGVSPDYILIGAGSGDLLCASAMGFGIEGGNIVSAFPTFPMLMNYAQVFNCTWNKVNLNDKLECDYNALDAAVDGNTKLVFICNPNNPSGTLVDPQIVKSFCENTSKKVTVYSDEAYLEFLEPAQQVSMVDLVRKNANVVVSRTFSKIYGLAGLRLGYLIAKPDLLKKVSKYLPGIAHNQIGIAAAKACLDDKAFMEMTRKRNADARKVLTDYLDKKGMFYGKSYTNFVFIKAQTSAAETMSELAAKDIAIRIWDYQNTQWLRVSVGTTEEMKTFVKVFDSLA